MMSNDIHYKKIAPYAIAFLRLLYDKVFGFPFLMNFHDKGIKRKRKSRYILL